MATLVHKAMAYLGLVDDEEEEDYLDEIDDSPAAPGRVRQTAYPEGQSDWQGEYGPSPMVRPLGREERRETPSTVTSRHSIVRAIAPQKSTKVHVIAPARFSDAQEIGDLLRSNSPVIVNLQAGDRDLARRMIDFCSGVTYALGGSMEKVAEQVFLLTPTNVEVSAEERQRLQDRGLFQS